MWTGSCFQSRQYIRPPTMYCGKDGSCDWCQQYWEVRRRPEIHFKLHYDKAKVLVTDHENMLVVKKTIKIGSDRKIVRGNKTCLLRPVCLRLMTSWWRNPRTGSWRMLVRDVGRIQNIIGRVLSDTGQAYFVDAVRRCQSQFLFEYGGVEVEEEQVQHFSRENSGDCLTYRRARSPRRRTRWELQRRWLRMNCSWKQAEDPSSQTLDNLLSDQRYQNLPYQASKESSGLLFPCLYWSFKTVIQLQN